jgi:hypothetical protein
MAGEYNLISAAQYDKLMKLQKKLDSDNNAGKKHLLVDEKETVAQDDNNDTSEDSPPRIKQRPGTVSVEDNVDQPSVNDSDNEHVMDTTPTVQRKINTDNNNKIKTKEKARVDVDNVTVKKAKDVLRKHKRKQDTPAKFENVPTDDIEGIVQQFNDLLKKKVKRLITYMFKFGRDIKIEKDILYYKTDMIGNVVKLIKSLFGVIPPMKGLNKLRKVLFILSVPSDLYILSTSERKKMSEKYTFDKEANPFKIDWLKY